MRADVAQRRRAQKRIDDGVEQDVGVGMPPQPHLARYLHPAQDEPPPRLEAVRVVPETYAHIVHDGEIISFLSAGGRCRDSSDVVE